MKIGVFATFMSPLATPGMIRDFGRRSEDIGLDSIWMGEQAMRGARRLVFVAGTMRELGEESAALHAAVARELVALKPDVLAAVGEFAPALEAHRGELGDRLILAEDVPALGQALARRLAGNEFVVLKASRGVALERIIPLLTPRTAHGS